MRHQLTTLVLGEVSKEVRGDIFSSKTIKSAPHYFEISVPHQLIIADERERIDGHDVIFRVKGYAPDIVVLEGITFVENIFDEKIFALEKLMFARCYEILRQRGGSEEWSEMYSVFAVSGYSGIPEQFLTHAPIIAALLKSEHVVLDQKEIDYTLAAQIKYAQHDLAIIDWDGAFLFDDEEGDIEPTTELLTLANLQLLRHRILDRQLDGRLSQMANLVKTTPKKFPLLAPSDREMNEHLQKIIGYRMDSIDALQRLERDIKLIGDWYSARLYDLAVKKFKIGEWRSSIREKLELVEDIYTIVVENFGLSRKDRAEFLQIILFFVLQIGWFGLIILEFLYFTK